MCGDHIDRIDLNRLADDGCPHDAAWEPGARRIRPKGRPRPAKMTGVVGKTSRQN